MDEGDNAITNLGARARCTLMRAPLDYANPALGELQVALLRVSAEQPQQRMGAILFNPGGPGSDGLTLGAEYADLWAIANPNNPTGKQLKDLGNRYDMVGFSPRGVGASSALTCTSNELLRIQDDLTFYRSPENIKNAQFNARLEAQTCLKNPLAKHIHTDATARDMDLVRSLLGDAKLNYIGYSYGTWLGAWYASLFPERVGRMLLDSNMNVAGSFDDANLGSEMGRHRVMDDIVFTYTARHAPLFNLGSNASQIKSRFSALAPGLKSETMALMNLNNAQDFDLNPLRITAAVGLQALRQTMPQASPASMEAAIQTYTFTSGRYNAVAASLATQLNTKLSTPKVRERVVVKPDDAVHTSVVCNDMATVGDEQRWTDLGNEYAARYPLTGGGSTANPCLYWGAPYGSKPPLSQAAKAGPLLMLQSRFDAPTPIEGALKTLDALPNARMIVIENEYSHGLFPYNTACVDGQVADYFLNGNVPPRTSACAGKPLPADASVSAPAPASRKAQSVPATGTYTDPEKAEEKMRRIHKRIGEASRRP